MTIAQGEYKSQVGLDMLYFAPITKDDATGYTAGTPVWLAPAGTAKSNTSSNQKLQYADDGVFESVNEEGETTVDIEVTNVPLKTAAEVSGKTFNAATGSFIDDDDGSGAPEFALMFRSKKSNGKYRYICYYKGKFALGDEDYSTQSGSPEPKMAKLKYTAVRTIFAFTTATGRVRTVRKHMVDEDDPASAAQIANWFTAVPVPVAPSP